MSDHPRKRPRQKSNNSSTSRQPSQSQYASGIPSPQTQPKEAIHWAINIFAQAVRHVDPSQAFDPQLCPISGAIFGTAYAATNLPAFKAYLTDDPAAQGLRREVANLYAMTHPLPVMVGAEAQTPSSSFHTMDASVDAVPPIRTYASVASEASAPTPSPPPTPPLCPSPQEGPRPALHSPKPHVDRPRKKVRFQGPNPKATSAAHPIPPNQLIAHIAGKPDAFINPLPDLKAASITLFTQLVDKLKSSAPGCVPLSIRPSCIGNMVITFTPATPPALLLSNLDAIRNALELTPTILITRNIQRTTIHLANVPTRSNSSSPVFDQAALSESVLSNPDLAGLAITSQPRWLRHPSSITKLQSSVVLSFEDPDGTLGQRILKAHVCVFGTPVNVKPWIIKPPVIPGPGPVSDSSMDCS